VAIMCAFDQESIRRLQLHLRRAGGLAERIIDAGKSSWFDANQSKVCAEELVTLLCQIRRYRQEVTLTAPQAAMAPQLAQHLSDLCGLRQCILHWLGQRQGKEQQLDDDLCREFEAQAWPALASGVLWLQQLESHSEKRETLFNPSTVADWWTDTDLLTIPARMEPTQPMNFN
jgi:hypothetical protein